MCIISFSNFPLNTLFFDNITIVAQGFQIKMTCSITLKQQISDTKFPDVCS